MNNPNCVMRCWGIILVKQQEQLVSTNETELNWKLCHFHGMALRALDGLCDAKGERSAARSASGTEINKNWVAH